MSDIKAFFHEWCSKGRKEPSFESRPTGNYRQSKQIKRFTFLTDTISQLGPKHRLRFLCEVRVAGIPYVGAGNSTNKKDAEKNAARDFVNFLVRTGQINADEVPANAIEQGGALPARVQQESVPVFQVCTIQ